MRVLVSGSTGLLGSALVPALRAARHHVVRLVRPGPGARPLPPDTRAWDPARGVLDPADLEDLDAVVHLGGENVAGWWTAAKKRRIRESRVQTTALLAGALARVATPPRVLVCASAVGYYGDRGAEVLTEASPPGTGFLAEVCRAWEAAAAPAAARGLRVVHTRFGIVLSAAGGPLAAMLVPFRLGLGGRIGGGTHFVSWVALDDAVAAIAAALEQEALAGPVNVVAPTPVTNAEFTATLGRVLGRPTVLAVPATPLRLLLGEMATEMLLVSQRAVPARLSSAGFGFRYPTLEPALRAALRHPG
jgi:uncharacterized protein (TIGR01777 family)